MIVCGRLKEGGNHTSFPRIEPNWIWSTVGRFINAVRQEQVNGPLRTKFKLETWKSDFDRLQDDDDDKHLFDAGLLIHEKAECIRSNLRVTFSKNLRSTTKLRGFAAIANYQHVLVGKAVREKMKELRDKAEAASPGAPVMMHELAAMKLGNGPAPLGPEEAIQGLVDGLQVPAKQILKTGINLSGSPNFADLEWDELQFDLMLGTLYVHLEGLWDDCLWNGCQPTADGRRVRFDFGNDFWLRNQIVGRTRLSALKAESVAHAVDAHNAMIYSGRYLPSLLGNVKSITKTGRSQVINVGVFERDSEELLRLVTMKILSTEPYYDDLLAAAQPRLQGATLDQLLNAWALVSSVARRLSEEATETEIKSPDNPNSWLPSFAPVLHLRALYQAASETCRATLAQGRALIEFLVYRGEANQELWAQPLLPVSQDAVVPIFAAAISPNSNRLIDVWLNQLGVDLSLRGHAFESYIRAQLTSSMAESPICAYCHCLNEGLNFTPPGERSEEIDIVAAIGPVILIGEAKCFLEPTEPKQLARHRDKVIDAARQVSRKADAVRRNKEQFRTRMRQVGVTLPQEFEVQPLVILNSAMHSGMPVECVPVVDEHILGVFLRGHMDEVAIRGSAGGFQALKKKVFYTSLVEATELLPGFLARPVQLEPLLAGLTPRWVQIPPVSEGDWTGLYSTLDCIIKMPGAPDEGEVPAAAASG